jgi:hypothetical protein
VFSPNESHIFGYNYHLRCYHVIQNQNQNNWPQWPAIGEKYTKTEINHLKWQKFLYFKTIALSLAGSGSVAWGRLRGTSSIGESSICGVLHHDGPDPLDSFVFVFFIVEAFYFVPCPVSAPLPPMGHLKGHRHIALRPIVRFFLYKSVRHKSLHKVIDFPIAPMRRVNFRLRISMRIWRQKAQRF